MARKVKGSKQYRMKVVPHRPFFGVFSVLGGLLLVLATSSAAYFAGQHRISLGLDRKTLAHEQALEQLEKLREENETLRLRVATAEQSVTIGEQASEKIHASLVERETRIAELQQEISFYRGLMAPADGSEGVSIGRFSITETGDSRRYQYKLLVQQSSARHNQVNGRVVFTIVGSEDGEPRSYPLSALSGQVEGEYIPLRFKYFQNIEGELQLPEGFEPQGVELSLKSSGRNGFNIEQRYGWLVQKT